MTHGISTTSYHLTDVKDLQAVGESIRKEFPNGPSIQRTVMPDRNYSFNEIAQNIRTQLVITGKSLI